MNNKNLMDLSFKSQTMQSIKNLFLSLIPLESNINISGPPGSGKSSCAHYLLKNSRCEENFTQIDVKEIEEEKFKYELEKNKFKYLLIENIEFLHKENQNVLIQFIQKNALFSKQVIITTSARDLKELAQSGQLRKDLYYKLTVFKVQLPALKEISEDIGIISNFYLKFYAEIYKKENLQFSTEAEEKLRLYFWPGNFSELESVIERAVILTQEQVVSEKCIRFDDYQKHASLDLSLGMSLSEVERRLILQTLEHTENNRTKAAHILGISIRTLRNKLNEYKELGLL